MRILFLCGAGFNARLRVRSLERMQHQVEVVPYDSLTPFREAVLMKWLRLPVGDLVDGLASRGLTRCPALSERYDLAFLNQPRILGPRCYGVLQSRSRHIVNYVNDDPFGLRHLPQWRLFLRTLPSNDLVAVSRDANVLEAMELGARRVLRVPFPADEELHRPIELTPEERQHWSSEVLFIGTHFPERGPFLRELIERGVPLTIRGAGWEDSTDWPLLRNHVVGGPVRGEDYVKAIRAAKISLGLLSKDNRDECTRRSMEIPAIGTLLCAERTREHRRLYEEGREAVFFDDARECAEQCLSLLTDDARRRAITEAGHQRFLRNGTTNRAMLERILAALNRNGSGGSEAARDAGLPPEHAGPDGP